MSAVNQLGKYQPYPDYKDSGVEWLGIIPENWIVTCIKRLSSNAVKSFTDGDWIESPHITDTGVRLIQTGNIGIGKYKEQGYRYISNDTFIKLRCTEVKPNDVLICRLAEPVGRACLAPSLRGKMLTSVDVSILKLSKDIDERYVVYFLTSNEYLGHLNSAGRGGTRQRIARSDLGDTAFVLPSINEQRTIAAFLDYETARIDQLIAKQQQLIELLKEKRQAVISHAVTKGLNPNAPMKDSGIEWLGQVPEHWVIKKISWDFSAQKGRNGQILTKEYCGQNQGSYPVYSGQTENDGVMGYISTHEFDFGSEGCLFSTTVGAKAMTLSLLKGKFSLSQNCMIITKKPQSHFNIEFSFFHFQPLFRYERGLIPEHMQASFRMEDLYQYSVAAPSIEEQICIVSHIKNETLRIDKLIQLSTESILYAQERRTALISAAVTGKIDLRGWQPPKSEVAA